MTQPMPAPWNATAPARRRTGLPVRGAAPRRSMASGRQMKLRNPVAAWLVLPLITLGVYHFVWYYKIHQEMAELDRRRDVPTTGPLLVILLLGWTVIAPVISYYNTGGRIREAQRASGESPSCSGLVGVLLMLAFGLGILYYQVELNKVTDYYGVPAGKQVPLLG